MLGSFSWLILSAPDRQNGTRAPVIESFKRGPVSLLLVVIWQCGRSPLLWSLSSHMLLSHVSLTYSKFFGRVFAYCELFSLPFSLLKRPNHRKWTNSICGQAPRCQRAKPAISLRENKRRIMCGRFITRTTVSGFRFWIIFLIIGIWQNRRTLQKATVATWTSCNLFKLIYSPKIP